MFCGLKGFGEAPYIWLGIILIVLALFTGITVLGAGLVVVGTLVWIYGDKLHGCL